MTLVEHGAFSLLLDYFYATEKPIPDDRCDRIANAYADYEREAVRAVLKQFFVETAEGWVNNRAVVEIEASKSKSLKAKGSAERRWGDSQCERNANASETQCDGNASHKPLAISHKPLKEKPPVVPQGDAPAVPTSRKRKSKPGGTGLDAWLDTLDGADAVPADDSIFDWAEKQSIPADWLGYAWAAFEDRYAGKDKTYLDWRASFRDHVKRGWLDIWRADARSGGFVLTTVGEQWRREVSA